MKRNILLFAESGQKKLEKASRYGLSISELKEIADDQGGEIYEAITQAYAAGFEAGIRYQKRKGQ